MRIKCEYCGERVLTARAKAHERHCWKRKKALSRKPVEVPEVPAATVIAEAAPVKKSHETKSKKK